MKKKILSVLAIVACAVCGIFAAACGGSAGTLGFDETKLVLDRYEERVIVPTDGNADGLTLTVADESVATADGNRLIAQGEGTTAVTAKRGKETAELEVKVYDTGAKMTLGADKAVAYLETETDIGVHVEYNGAKSAYGEAYELRSSDEDIAEIRGGKVYGKRLGTVRITATLRGYKGVDEIVKTFIIEIKEPSFVEIEEDELSVYNAKDPALNKIKINAAVTYKTEEIENPALTYTVLSGGEHVAVDGEGNVSAVTEGEARIKVAYEPDQSYFDEVTVKVYPNYVESGFVASGILGSEYGEYDGEEPIGGRTGADGVMRFKAGDLTGATGESFWSYRLINKDNGLTLVEAIKKGYKYFAFDVYYTCEASMYVGLEGTDLQMLRYGAYMRSDYLKILDEDGKIVNRLTANKWLTFAYDLNYYVYNGYATKGNMGFFYSVARQNNVSYLDNIRWYLDDEYYDHDSEISLVKNDGYIAAGNDEFRMKNSPYKAELWSGSDDGAANASVYENAGDGTAYRYTVNRGDGLPASGVRLVLSSSTAAKTGTLPTEGPTAANGMKNLTELGKYVGDETSAAADKYKYVTFDFNVEYADNIYFALNGGAVSRKVKLATAENADYVGVTNLEKLGGWLRVYERGGSSLARTIKAGEWYTACLAYLDNYDEGAASSEILFGAYKTGDSVLIDNIRYYKEDGFVPRGYTGFAPDDDRTDEEVTGVRLGDGSDEACELYTTEDGCVKFVTTYVGTDSLFNNSSLTLDIASSGLADNEELSAYIAAGYKYVALEFKLGGNFGLMRAGTYVWEIGGNTKDIVAGQSNGSNNMLVYGADRKLVKGEVTTDEWYTLYIPANLTDITRWSRTYLALTAKDDSAPAFVSVRNIEAVKSLPELYDMRIAPIANADKLYLADGTLALTAVGVPATGVTWTSSDQSVATVDENGLVTVKKHGATTVSLLVDGKTEDSVTLTFLGFKGVGMEEKNDNHTADRELSVEDDGSVRFATKNDDVSKFWHYSAMLMDATSGFTDNALLKAYVDGGYKYVALDFRLNDNVKAMKAAVSVTGYGKTITVGEANGSNNMLVYTLSGKTLVKGAIEANTWYRLYIDANLTSTSWTRTYISLAAKDGNAFAEVLIKNIALYTELPEHYDVAIAPVAHADQLYLADGTLALTAAGVPATGVTWTSSDQSVATVNADGLLTAKKYGKTTVSLLVDGKVEDSAALTILGFKGVRMESATSAGDLAIADDGVIRYTTDNVEGSPWSYGFMLSAASTGSYDSAELKAYVDAGYKYVSLDFKLGANVKTTRAGVFVTGIPSVNKDITAGQANGANNMLVYEIGDKTLVKGAVAADKWYRLYIRADLTDASKWTKVYLGVQAKDATAPAELSVRNISCLTELPEHYDMIISGAPDDTIYMQDYEADPLKLTITGGAPEGYEWASSDEEVATVSDNGTITMLKAGETTISLKLGDEVKDSFTLNVADRYAAPPEGWHPAADDLVWLDGTADEAALRGSYKFTATESSAVLTLADKNGTAAPITGNNYTFMRVRFSSNVQSVTFYNGKVSGTDKIYSQTITIGADYNPLDCHVKFYTDGYGKPAKIEANVWYFVFAPAYASWAKGNCEQVTMAVTLKTGQTSAEVYFNEYGYGTVKALNDRLFGGYAPYATNGNNAADYEKQTYAYRKADGTFAFETAITRKTSNTGLNINVNDESNPCDDRVIGNGTLTLEMKFSGDGLKGFYFFSDWYGTSREYALALGGATLDDVKNALGTKQQDNAIASVSDAMREVMSFADAEGNEVTQIEKDVWYTVTIKRSATGGATRTIISAIGTGTSVIEYKNVKIS